MKSILEQLEKSEAKKALDTLRNQMLDNQALTMHSPILSGVNPAMAWVDEGARDLFGNVVPEPGAKKKARPRLPGEARNERDELFNFFYPKLASTWGKSPQLTKGYLAMKISHLSVQDLYYLKSVCLDAERRGVPFSKVFWGSLKPRPEK